MSDTPEHAAEIKAAFAILRKDINDTGYGSFVSDQTLWPIVYNMVAAIDKARANASAAVKKV